MVLQATKKHINEVLKKTYAFNLLRAIVMGLKTEGTLGIIGGVLLILTFPTFLLRAMINYEVSISDIFNLALIGWVLFAVLIALIVMGVVLGLILIVAGALLASGKKIMALALSMIVFGVLSLVFSPVCWGFSVEGLMGINGGILGIVGGALARKEILRQEVPPPPFTPPP